MPSNETCGIKQLGRREYYCHVELFIQILGGKWKPIILWHLNSDDTLRFGELKRTMPNITQKMLTQQLREMESDGLVHREVYPQVPPRVEYSLTALGHSAVPLLHVLCEWGKEYERVQCAGQTGRDAA